MTIKEVMALVKESSLLISGDTFALQAACALSRPVVGIFGPTNPGRNGPFSPEDKVAFHEIPCSFCYKRKCSKLECLKKISAEQVASLSLNILKNA
jgi:heptosyltransferase-1